MNVDSGEEEGTILHVLFVCTGNICRSPIGERLATAYASEARMTRFRASSAGVNAVVGNPIHPAAARALEAHGGDSTAFAARQITPAIASVADLIITMTQSHRNAVLELAPRQLRRTFTLAEAAALASESDAERLRQLATMRPRVIGRNLVDIPDPIGRDIAFFGNVAAQIDTLLQPVLKLCFNELTSS